ncbi:MAG: MATE family efflux transporter [Lachnospiraceae bacterium]|nr:MATE family efflux transporter [Lachnospiraceae bacterium]
MSSQNATSSKENRYLVDLREGKPLSLSHQIQLVISLSIPAILAQVSSVVMQYIDASMVGTLGANASASIGLMSSSLWMIWGITSGGIAGFAVQVAHRIGARDEAGARSVVRHGLMTMVAVALCIALLCFALSGPWPVWLGGNPDIVPGARTYIRIYILFFPVSILRMLSGSMLQNSGNMKVPSTLNIIMCGLDVVFNYLLIFPSGTREIFGQKIWIPGAGLGVAGAALGTVLAEAVCACFMLYFLNRRFRLLHYDGPRGKDRYLDEVERALKIGVPLSIEQMITGGAYVMFTRIVAPLGTIPIAANSFSTTAESLCYMPGYGISMAATTLVGQSTGAGREDMTKRLGWLTVAMGVLIMTGMSVLMFFGAPWLIGFLTPDPAIRDLGVRVLRIEAFAEPLFAASIIVTGVFRGAGKTLIPSILNFLSMWLVRIPLAAFLATRFGLPGVWSAMCAELCVRGILFLMWMRKEYR